MFLDKIVAKKNIEVEQLSAHFSLAEAERTISGMPPCKGFVRALMANRHRPVGLIAEVKKASPSKGLIREHFDPVSLARAYEDAGADCISILTDIDFFQGRNEFLTQVRKAVTVPLLRKDFTINYRQIYEARMIGADAILLIAAILTTKQMHELQHTAHSIGLDVLVEVHNEEELERSLKLEPELIGINNRNLKTFEVSLNTTEELAHLIHSGIGIVSESGISKRSEIDRLQQAGIAAVLVGEHFMRQQDVGKAIYNLMGGVTIDD